MISRLACGAVAAFALAAACDGTEGTVLGLAPEPPEAGGSATDIDASITASVTLDDGGVTASHGGDSGDEHVDVCPGDQVVVGFDGYVTGPDSGVGLDLVSGVRALCGAVAVVGSRLVVSTGTPLSTWGQLEDVAWSASCPSGMVVVGVSGRSGAALDALAVECASWVAVDGGGATALAIDARQTLGANGGDGGTAFDQPCPDGDVARGVDVHAGQWIDAFALVCGRPTLR